MTSAATTEGGVERPGNGARRHLLGVVGAGEMRQVIALGAAASVLSLLLSDFWIVVVGQVFLIGAMGVAWNILAGLLGYVSLANHAFYGLGAYAVAGSMTTYGMPFGLGVAMAALAGGIAAVAIGIPVLRLRGHYFIVGSFAAGTATAALFYAVGVFGSSPGVPLYLPLNGLSAQAFDRFIYMLSLGVLCIALVAFISLRASRWGIALLAIKADETAAQGLGVRPYGLKLIAFAITGVLTGLAGAVGAYQATSVDPAQFFDLGLLIQIIVAVVLGGLGTTWGPVAGAAFVVVITQVSGSFQDIQVMLYAGLVIAVVLIEPRGLFRLLMRFGQFLGLDRRPRGRR
jgi:branched-chain amino acid transport system permease protein